MRTLADRTGEAYIVYIQKLALHAGCDPADLDAAGYAELDRDDDCVQDDSVGSV